LFHWRVHAAGKFAFKWARCVYVLRDPHAIFCAFNAASYYYIAPRVVILYASAFRDCVAQIYIRAYASGKSMSLQNAHGLNGRLSCVIFQTCKNAIHVQHGGARGRKI
jgi:hypothetical protein